MSIADPIGDWTVSVLIGFLTVSHWRGLWTLLDIWTCDQPDDASLAEGTSFCFAATLPDKRLSSAVTTYMIGVVSTLLASSLMWCGGWKTNEEKVTPSLTLIRLVTIYILGLAAVTTWRGIWYMTDHWIFPDDPVLSYWLTSFVGAGGAFTLCSGASLLAPPAIFFLDGPSHNPPPLAVTIVSTYYELKLPAEAKSPVLPVYVYLVDSFFSFLILPIFVIWFWRGTWLLMDYYLWGFTDSDSDIAKSLIWSSIICVACCILTCEPIMYFFENYTKIWSELIGRIRTFVEAWGTVNFWRVVWFVWDQYLGGTSNLSAWMGHVGSIACLTAMGCVCSIVAPPSTVGVDCVPHPKASEEPLFSMLPLPWDMLYVCAIARNPAVQLSKEPPVEPETKGGLEPEISKLSIEPEEEEIVAEEVEPGAEEITAPSSVSSFERMNAQWHAGVAQFQDLTFHDLQRPRLARDASTRFLCQRPGPENARHRSQYFRNR